MRSKIDIYGIDRVREMREAAEMSQEELSGKLDFRSNGFVGQIESRPTVSGIMSGTSISVR